MSHEPPPVSDQAVLKLANIEIAYGKVKVIHGISLQVRRGEIATVLGGHGAGKTTILKTISGVLHPCQGSIAFKGDDITAGDPAFIVSQGLSHVPQGSEVFPHLSVHDNLMLGAYTRHDPDEVEQDLEDVYGYFPTLQKCVKQKAGLLSGAEPHMLAIARALMAAPDLMVLDEPCLGLSPALAQEIFEIVVRINRERGITLLLAEQHADRAIQVADYGYVLGNGRIVMEDTCAHLRDKEDLQKFYRSL